MSVAPPLDFEERKRKIFGEKEAAGQESKGPGRPSKAAQIIELVHSAGAVLSHTADREAFVTVLDDHKHRITMATSSAEFRQWVSLLYWKETKGAVGGDAIKSAIDTLAAEAIFTGPERAVFNRIAHVWDGDELTIYVDLGTAHRRVVKVTATGWTIVESASVPVLFRRPGRCWLFPSPSRAEV
jgi:hypothetical protein